MANNQDKIHEKFPVKITPYLSKIIKHSIPIKKQFTLDINELRDEGVNSPWDIKRKYGVTGLENISNNKAVIMPTTKCSAYCRHCIRKDRESKDRDDMSLDDIIKSSEILARNSSIKEVIITGGDPFIRPDLLLGLLEKLRKIEHIHSIRIGTRLTVVDPDILSIDLLEKVASYNTFGNPIEISVQYNHVDELTRKSVSALERLHSCNLRVYNQSVLLKGINDDAEILGNLYTNLLEMGVEMLYLYHCAPIRGVDHLRTSVSKGIEIKKDFTKMDISGRAIPKYIIVTSLGKLEPFVDCEIINKENQFLYLKTFYSQTEDLPKDVHSDLSGNLIVKYLDGVDD